MLLVGAPASGRFFSREPPPRRRRSKLQLPFGGGGVDDAPDGGNAVRREAALLGVLADRRLVWRDINAVNLVVGHVAVQPLDLRTHVA